MSAKIANSQHDALFKKIMENPIAAQEFLEYYLPADFKAMVDLASVKIEKDSFVEEDLKRNISDLVYSVKLKGSDENAFVYTLVEHQSTNDNWISFRMWKYMLLMAERHKTAKEKIPLIVPIVVYVRREVVLCSVIIEKGGKRKKIT